MPNYQFDALQYCRSNMGRSKMANGCDPMELIAAELERNLYIIEVWKRKPAMNVQRKHDSLREAVKKMLHADKPGVWDAQAFAAARAEVDRLIAEADCKGEG